MSALCCKVNIFHKRIIKNVFYFIKTYFTQIEVAFRLFYGAYETAIPNS